METNLLFQFLCRTYPENKEYYELIRYELDARIYHFGDHYQNHFEKRKSFSELIRESITGRALEAVIFFKGNRKSKKGYVLSTAYFNLEKKVGSGVLAISRPPWQYNMHNDNIYDIELYRQAMAIKVSLREASLHELFSNIFIDRIRAFEHALEKWLSLNNFRALFVPSNVTFFDKISVKVFKKLGFPSFTFIHGLPGGYSKIDNGLADYIAVWGNSIKLNYIAEGISSEKVIVTGHPDYKAASHKSLQFDFSDILVISKSLPGTQSGGRYTLRDRSNLIYYLMSIRKTLEELGIKKARLRPHPSENKDWYKSVLGEQFFVIDDHPLNESLKKATLLIGPTSTLFVEALLSGVNYVVFEPRLAGGEGLDGGIVVPPFDGSDERVPSASSTEELNQILMNRKSVEPDVLNDYISKNFDATEVIRIIEEVFANHGNR